MHSIFQNFKQIKKCRPRSAGILKPGDQDRHRSYPHDKSLFRVKWLRLTVRKSEVNNLIQSSPFITLFLVGHFPMAPL